MSMTENSITNTDEEMRIYLSVDRPVCRKARLHLPTVR